MRGVRSAPDLAAGWPSRLISQRLAAPHVDSVTGLLVSVGFRPGMIASRASFLRVDTFLISYP